MSDLQTRQLRGGMFYRKYMTCAEYDKFEPLLKEMIAKMFTAQVDIKPVKYLCNKRTECDGVAMEARITFPFLESYLFDRVDEHIKHAVSGEMKRYQIKIIPTLKDTHETE